MRIVLALALLLSLPVHAQEYPAKPIRMLIPFAPGGAVDTTARVLAQAMQQRVNWQFVIENRPGGNGFIATTAVAESPNDGYTLLMAHTGEFAVNPALFDNVPYELERDFVAISRLADIQDILGSLQVVHQNVSPMIQQADKVQDEAIGKALADLKAFVAGVHTQEKGGKRFKPEEADTLGKEAQDRADAIVGQVTQVAAKLGVKIEQ